MLTDNFYSFSSDGELLLDMCYLAAATAYMDFTESSDELQVLMIDSESKTTHHSTVESFLADLTSSHYCWPTIIRQFGKQVSYLERELIGFEVTQTNPFYDQISNEGEDFPWEIVDRRTDVVLDALDTSFNFGQVNSAIENLVERIKHESKSSYTKAGEWIAIGAGGFLEGFGVVGASSLGEWGSEKFLNRKAGSLDYELAAAVYAAAIAYDAQNSDISKEILKQWREIIIKEGKKTDGKSRKITAIFSAGIKTLGEILQFEKQSSEDDLVPNLRNLKLDKAIVVCQSLDIKLNYLDVRAEIPGQNARSIMMTENWTVKKQNPHAGAKHLKGRKVTVYVDRH